jgi:hypothetical protein
LISAASNGKAAEVDRLIKSGADKEAKDAVRSSVFVKLLCVDVYSF